MSYTIIRTLGRKTGNVYKVGESNSSSFLRIPALLNKTQRAKYSRRSDSKNIENSFKVVKSKVRVQENEGFLGVECGPNWEILSPRGNRFYLPHAVGPAWQGANTTITLEAPLESLVDFEGNAEEETAMLAFSVSACPSLIRKSLHELFPTAEVLTSEKLALVTLSYNGDTEMGARKFVLAAREITSRLRLHGYWADFINPFSGKPFYSWASEKNLYKIDQRFRGLNMKLIQKNHCVLIMSDDGEHKFSGAIYTNAPADYLQVKTIIDNQFKP